MATLITENFSLEELEKSATATRRGIKNEIPRKLIINAVRLCDKALQPIRDAFCAPIIVTSGYRCPELNKTVGGVTNSQHLEATAADIKTSAGTLAENRKLWNCIMAMKDGRKLEARQIIWEGGDRSIGPAWIHISINDKEHSFKINEVIYNY